MEGEPGDEASVCVCVCVYDCRYVVCMYFNQCSSVYPVGDERVILLYNGSTDLIHKMTQVQKS